MISSAKEWGAKSRTELLTLPSGVVIEIKVSKLKPLLLANILPYDLLAKIVKGGKNGNMTEQDRLEMINATKKLFEIISISVISPRIVVDRVPDEGKNEISIYDIPDEDMDAIRSYLMGTKEAHEAGTFRDEPTGAPAGSSV